MITISFTKLLWWTRTVFNVGASFIFFMFIPFVDEIAGYWITFSVVWLVGSVVPLLALIIMLFLAWDNPSLSSEPRYLGHY